MKKVLFATTALVASAGIASAQGVELSGSAEMGIIGGDPYANDIEFHTDIDIKFTLSGETDNGLTFGATIDLDESQDSNGNFSNRDGGPESVFISGNWGTLTMGDTDGAFDWALREVGIGTSIADDHTTHGGFNGNSRGDGNASHDGQIARYDYSFGDFAFAASIELDDTGVLDPTFGIGGRWAGDVGGGWRLSAALAFQDYDIDSEWGLSLAAAYQGFTAILNYSDLGDSDGGGVAEDHWGIGFGYEMDNWLFSANYGQYSEGVSEQSGYGVAVNYDLGGGAAVQFGYGHTQDCGVYAGCVAGSNQWSFGIAMSF